MPLNESLIMLFGAVFAVLGFSTLIGAGLKLRVAQGRPHAAIDNLNGRVRAWWWMVTALALAFWAGSVGTVLLFVLVSFQALREFVSLTYTRRGDHRALMWSFFFFLPMQYWLAATGWYGLFTILIPVYAFLLLPISAALGKDTTRFLERAAKVQWGLMICVYCVSHIPALSILEIPGFEGRAPLLIAFLVLTVQSSDVFQYVWGKLIGKRRLAPEISPSKTLEGLIGGVATATALGTALWWITPFSPWQAAVIALVVNLAGFFGGFVLSAIKRDRGVKDWGTFLEGHGGMLDRIDSLSFAAPVFFHMVRYWWVP